MLVKLGKRVWLHRNGCRHSVMIDPDGSPAGICSTC
jgi:hypothetical protein